MKKYHKNYLKKGVRVIYPKTVVTENSYFPSMIDRIHLYVRPVIGLIFILWYITGYLVSLYYLYVINVCFIQIDDVTD